MKETILKILQEIKPILVERKDGNYIEEELLESMEIMDIIVKLEENFKIEIAPEDIISDNFRNMDTLAELVSKSKKI